MSKHKLFTTFATMVIMCAIFAAPPVFAWSFDNYSRSTSVQGSPVEYSVEITDSTDCVEQTYTIAGFLSDNLHGFNYPLEYTHFFTEPITLLSGTGMVTGTFSASERMFVPFTRVVCLYMNGEHWDRADSMTVNDDGYFLEQAIPFGIANGGTGRMSFATGSVLFANGASLSEDGANFSWNDSTNVLEVSGIQLTDDLQVAHLDGAGSAPSIATGTCLGGGSAVIRGTDTAGEVLLTTGALPILGGTCATVTFTQAYDSAPYVVFSARNAAGAAGIDLTYVTSTASTFSFVSANLVLSPLTTYIWSYHVIE